MIYHPGVTLMRSRGARIPSPLLRREPLPEYIQLPRSSKKLTHGLDPGEGAGRNGPENIILPVSPMGMAFSPSGEIQRLPG